MIMGERYFNIVSNILSPKRKNKDKTRTRKKVKNPITNFLPLVPPWLQVLLRFTKSLQKTVVLALD